ncbi:MAG TPA: carbon-nitrogen family hydrolase [Verrucomicrobiae bacterium]|nr:carbon-nitrogen family hydrolase [Verrucomicrobiae bacterium]
MKVICAQLDIAWEERQANFAKVRAMVDKFRPDAGALLVLPEMFSSGFSMNVAKVKEGTPSATEQFLGAIARLYSIYVIAGVVTQGADGKGKNEAIVIDIQGRTILRYSKLHPFTLGGESQHYSAGDCIELFNWLGFMTAPFICYDLRFPEIFRAATRKGAHLFTVIANWPNKREGHWVTLLQARAIETQAYVVGVNRCGSDPGHLYPGRTLIVDPHGTVIADGGREEGLVTADIDIAKVVLWRKDFPVLQDTRMIAG